jgi:hypothetical protein
MHSGATLPPEPRTGRFSPDHPWLGVLIGALDRHLRRRQGIVEYTSSPDCIFRMQVIPSGRDVALSDGTRLRASDRVIELHFWNEQLPSVPERGSDFAWGWHITRCGELSLRELVRHLAARPDLADVRAIRGNMSLGSAERSDQIARLVARYGFERVPPAGPPKLSERVHRLGENILISMLVIARNAAALRTDTLRRDRVMVYLSRQALEQRYRFGRAPPT